MGMIVSLLVVLAADPTEQNCNWMQRVEEAIIIQTDRGVFDVRSIQFPDGMIISGETSDHSTFEYCMTNEGTRSCTVSYSPLVGQFLA